MKNNAYQQQLRREDNTLLEDNAGAAIQQKLANFAQAEAAKYHPLVNARRYCGDYLYP